MAFPKNEKELSEQGYIYKGQGNCRRCGARMNWYQTPKGKLTPLDPDCVPHWATCPHAKEFKK